MKKIDLKCKNCGAIMDLSEDKTEAYCPYCQNKFLLEKVPTLEEISDREEKISYAKKTGENKAEEEYELRRKKRKMKKIIITSLIIILFIVIIYLINYFSLEYMEDPFKCVDVKFSGSEGNGTIEIVDNKTCSNFIDIKYTVTKSNKLKENEQIRINATSTKYRFGTSMKEYLVSGLSLYLKNLDALDEKILTKLHNQSYEYIKNNSFGISFKGVIESLTPYKIYLYTNQKTKNVLYDVYKAEVKTSSGNIYEKYLVASYENFILLENEQLYSHTRLNKCGNVILAGAPNEYNAMNKDYAGNLTGFLTVSDFENYINKDNDGSFIVIQK